MDYDSSIAESFREICRRIFCSSLGESAGEAIIFFLRRELKRDPFEMVWEDPKAVYHAMEKTLGVGAKVLINVLVTTINRECGLNMDPERFLDFIRSGNQESIEEIRYFIRRVVESYGSRSGGIK